MEFDFNEATSKATAHKFITRESLVEILSSRAGPHYIRPLSSQVGRVAVNGTLREVLATTIAASFALCLLHNDSYESTIIVCNGLRTVSSLVVIH